MPRQTPIVPKLTTTRAAARRAHRARGVVPELCERSLDEREHLRRDDGAGRARYGVEDVGELEGGEDEAAALGLALAGLARDELLERDRLARDALPQLRHLRHQPPALGLVRFAAELDEQRRDTVGVDRL